MIPYQAGTYLPWKTHAYIAKWGSMVCPMCVLSLLESESENGDKLTSQLVSVAVA